jgi:hypothetical protein
MQPPAGRRTASLQFMKTPPLEFTLVDSFAPRSVAATLRLYRLPAASQLAVFSPALADLGPVRHLRDEEVNHGEMEGLAPDHAGHSG